MGVLEVWKESEQLLVCLNVALVGRNRAKKLTSSLVTDLVSSVNAAFSEVGI